MKIQVNSAALAASLGCKSGDVLEVEDRKGVPRAREWRNRLRDAAIDGCVSIPQNKRSKTVKPPTEGSQDATRST